MEASNGSNRSFNSQYIDDNMKSRFALDKMISRTNEMICLLETCQKCIDGISKTVYHYRELQRRFIDEM